MPATSHKLRVAFSVTNCICHDQRVLKMADAVSKLNCDITIIGRKRGDCCESDTVPFNTRRFRMIFKRGFLFYKFYNIRLFCHLLFHRYDLLVSNDLDTLLPNFMVSKIKRSILVYDSHEYFTGLPEIQHRPFVKRVWGSIEKAIVPGLKYIITVSDPIAIQLENLYGVKPLVIRNTGKSVSHIIPFTRGESGVPADHMLLIIHGTGINIDKGAEELIDAVNITEGVSLLVVGSGDVVPQLKNRVKSLSLDSRVNFIPAVPWETLIRYIKSADIGLCLEKDTNLNYHYSLPNKLFDYIASGIPVVAGFLPESGKIIREYNCGLIIPKVSPEEISMAIIKLRDNPDLLSELKSNAVKASGSINWKSESAKVNELYKSILDSIRTNL